MDWVDKFLILFIITASIALLALAYVLVVSVNNNIDISKKNNAHNVSVYRIEKG
jgi:hypothetical protein